jgi:hypothetical protein
VDIGDAEGRGVSFTDVTHELSPSLEKPGLIAAALWTDFDQDGWVDLLLAGEWMPLTFFKNEHGKFVDVTAGTGLAKYTGWWNSLTGGDFDKDGDIDYVAGNLGLNTPYRVSQTQPMQIIAKDFDTNGAIDPICCYYVQGKNYPMYNRDLLISQIPALKKKFTTYDAYATATISDIFSEEEMEEAYVADTRYHESSYIENNGDGTYSIHPLPIEAQFAPVFGLLANDFNHDGHLDLLLAGNSYDVNAEPGQYDASIGLFLSGDGQGNFQPIPGRESGFFVDGDVKGMAALTKNDGSTLILVAQNAASLQAFSTTRKDRVVPLEKEDAAAILYYESGVSEQREFYYGSGYLSQSSRVCAIPIGVDSLKIRKYSGETRELIFK